MNKRAILLIHLLALASACLAAPETEPDTQDQVDVAADTEALTLCDPMFRYHTWFATFNKVPFESCQEGPYWRGEDQYKSVFCYVQTQNSGLIYRGYGIQRPGRNRLNTLSFDNYACEFQSCDIYQASMTCNCSYCYTSGWEPAPR